jgi:hypothetical protein
MRLQLDQIEAMQKLKGLSGQQKVTVEHVTALRGGQAIVGAIEAPKIGKGRGGQSRKSRKEGIQRIRRTRTIHGR